MGFPDPNSNSFSMITRALLSGHLGAIHQSEDTTAIADVELHVKLWGAFHAQVTKAPCMKMFSGNRSQTVFPETQSSSSMLCYHP